MPSHEDIEHQIAALNARAKDLTAKGQNQITAGAPGEVEMQSGIYGRTFIKRLPDDPLALRISIGEARGLSEPAYLVMRGDPALIEGLLSRALDDFRLSGWGGKPQTGSSLGPQEKP